MKSWSPPDGGSADRSRPAVLSRRWKTVLLDIVRWPLVRIHRSILGQMILITALFLGFGVYFAVRPILSMPPMAQPSPLETTSNAVSSELNAAMVAADNDPQAIAKLRQSPLLQDVEAKNPDFTYYIARGDVSGGTAQPRFLRQEGLTRLEDAIASVRDDTPGAADRASDFKDLSFCVQMERQLSEPLGKGYVTYGNCGVSRYVEFHGLRSPIELPVITEFEAKVQWAWDYSRNFLLPTLGLFVLVLGILAINIVRIRRVARLTRSLDLDGPGRAITPQGLPSEMLPLVGAVNQLIRQAEKDQRRRRFFLSAAAHELRTPLTVLRTRMESLEDGALKDQLIRDLAQLTQLSNDLLMLMSIERRSRDFTTVDLAQICMDVIADLDPIADARGVGFDFDMPREGCTVLGDPALIRVALANLIDNAISFAPPGTDVDVHVKKGGTVLIRDHGRGLRVDDPDSLFEPFVRASGGDRPGYGLGLAIVKAVADHHGAHIRAEDAQGGGACFRLDLPPQSQEA